MQSKKANAVHFALSRLTRRAFHKESECRMQDHETTRPQTHKTIRATRNPVQLLAESEVADLRRNYVDLPLPAAPSGTALLAQRTLDDISEKCWRIPRHHKRKTNYVTIINTVSCQCPLYWRRLGWPPARNRRCGSIASSLAEIAQGVGRRDG